MSEEWVTVSSKGKLRRNGAGGAHPFVAAGPHQPASDRPPTAAQVGRWCSLVGDARAEVAASPFYAALRTILAAAAVLPALAPAGGGGRPPQPLLRCARHLVVWGLGSLGCGLVHIRYQLALALLLRGLLGGEAAAAEGCSLQKEEQVDVEAYDPVFSALDRAVLQEYSIRVTPHNPEGRHIATHPTLFWLPHCELELTEQLLASNAAAGTLCNLALLGNSFALYRERWELTRGRRPKKQPGPNGGGGLLPAGAEGNDCHGSSSSSSSSMRTTPAAGQQQRQQQQHGQEGAEDPLCRAEGLLVALCTCGAVEERAVGECGFPVASAFNDMALHTFAPDWRGRLARQRGLA